MCALAAATMLACGIEDDAPEEFEVASDATICSVRSAGDSWWVATFPQKTGRFHVLVEATPSNNNIDAVIGLSKGAASKWTQLAAIVRFAPTGVIDVRRGGAYAADIAYPYSADTTYFFRIDVDVSARSYSVWVKDRRDSQYTALASNFAFRTEQASVTSLDAAAVYLEPSRPGSLQVCGLDAIQDDSTADGCVTSTAGGTFANAWMPPVQGAMVAKFSATPSMNLMDGVVGYSLDAADAYNDYAASVRFWTNGFIEARDGDVYRATNAMRYEAGRTYHFHVVLDFATATYFVYANAGLDPSTFTLIAEGFRFRPQQLNIGLINNLATVVASTAGQVRACGYVTTSDHTLRNIRTGSYSLAPFRDGRTAISSGTHTEVIDSTGKTLASAALAAQTMAVDGSGNLFLATLDSGTTTLTLRAVTSTLQPRWTRTYPVSGGIHALGAYDNGDIVIALGAPGHGVAELLRLRPDGSEHSRLDLTQYPAHAVGIGRNRFAIAYRTHDALVIEARATDGQLIWERRWTGDAGPERIAVDAGGGIAFGGSFGYYGGGVDFGTGWFEPTYSEEVTLNGYIVALSPTGELRFANRLYTASPSSLVTNGGVIAYATTQWSQTPHPQLWVYGLDGAELRGGNVTLVDDAAGSLSEVVLNSEGLVIANTRLQLHSSANAPPWSVLASLGY